MYRQLRPDVPRPFRLPTFCKWIALLVFVAWMAIYFFGGWNSPKIVLADPHQGPGLYLLGLLIVALYAPLYWWRAWQDRKLAASGRLVTAPAAAVTGDGILGTPGNTVTEAEPSAGEPSAVR